VDIVEHEYRRLNVQSAQHGVDDDHEIGVGLAEEIDRLQPVITLRGAECRAHIAPERNRVPVVFLARNPRCRRAPLAYPRGEHDALTRARRCHYCRQWHPRTGIEHVEQPRPSDMKRRERRNGRQMPIQARNRSDAGTLDRRALVTDDCDIDEFEIERLEALEDWVERAWSVDSPEARSPTRG
jgi:hypothetical protein